VLIVLGGTAAASLSIDSGMDGLLAEDNPVMETAAAIEEEFGGQDNVILVVQGEPEKAKGYMDELAQSIEKAGVAQNIFYQFEMDRIQESGLLYIPTSNYEQLESELSDTESSLSTFLHTPDPNSFIELFQQRLQMFEESDQEVMANQFLHFFTPETELNESEKSELLQNLLYGPIDPEENDILSYEDGYIASENGNEFLMTIKPNTSSETFREDRDHFFATLDHLTEELAKHPDWEGIEAGYVGNEFVMDYESDQVVVGNIVNTLGITLLGIVGFMVFSFRRFLLPVASSFPLVLGVILTAALASLFYGELNMFSISFAVLLLGLGIDFAILIISRYLEERTKGKNLKDALYISISHTGPGMLIGAISTAVAFLAFVFADFQAFTQLGVMSAAGIILALLSMLIVFPSLIIWIDRKKESRTVNDRPFTFLQPVSFFVQRFKWIIITGALLFTIISAINLPKVSLNADMQTLYPDDLPSSQWTEVLEEEFEYNADTTLVMADNMEQTEEWVEKLDDLPSVQKVESVLNFIPDDQEFKLGIINEMEENLEDGLQNQQIEVTSAELATNLEGIRGEVEGIADPSHIAMLESLIGEIQSSTDVSEFTSFFDEETAVLEQAITQVPSITEEDLPPSVLSTFKGETGKYLIDIIPDKESNEEVFREEVDQLIPSAPGGMPFMIEEIISIISADIITISFIAGLAILLILSLLFRSLKDGLIAMVPTLLTILAITGFGTMVGLELNIMNVMALPMIIGLGVDGSVHILHRLRSREHNSLQETIVHTGKAIIITNLTAMIAFGSFLFVNQPGLASLGVLVIIGLGVCLLFTLLLLPALYIVFSSTEKTSAND
jgi:predicted RND superfamily exporter protein